MIEIYINWMDRWTQKITLVHVGSLVTILVCTIFTFIANLNRAPDPETV